MEASEHMKTHTHTRTMARKARARRGFTLVEILVAMSLLMVLMGLSVRLFASQSKAVSQQAGRLDAQQNSRFALSMIDRELRMAGVGVADAQPLLVEAAPLAITFNADLVALDTGDLNAVYINPDADSASVGVLTKAQQITLPTTTRLYPETTYTENTGVPSNAETISFWLSRDSTSTDSTQYILFRRANASAIRMVARGIRVLPTDTIFQYFTADSLGVLRAIAPAALPITHSATIHGSTADTGSSARTDSIKEVRVQLTSVYHDPRTGKDALRKLQTTVHLMNAGLIRHATCGQPPIAPTTVTAVATPADGVTVLQTFVTVAWTASVDDGGGEKDIQRYAIYRHLSSDTTLDQQPLSSVPAGSPTYSFTDTDVLSGQSWIYSVVAQDCTPAMSPAATAAAVVIP